MMCVEQVVSLCHQVLCSCWFLDWIVVVGEATLQDCALKLTLAEFHLR